MPCFVPWASVSLVGGVEVGTWIPSGPKIIPATPLRGTKNISGTDLWCCSRWTGLQADAEFLGFSGQGNQLIGLLMGWREKGESTHEMKAMLSRRESSDVHCDVSFPCRRPMGWEEGGRVSDPVGTRDKTTRDHYRRPRIGGR